MRRRFDGNDGFDDDEPLFQGLADTARRASSVESGAAVADGHLGYDSTGDVRITLDDQAVPLQVSLGDGWRRSVGSGGLSAAIVEAYRNAEYARLESGAPELPLAGKFSSDEPDAQPESKAHAEAPLDAAAVLEILDKAENHVSEVNRLLQSPGALGGEGASPGGEVVAAFDRGLITRVEFQAEWIDHTSDRDLESSVLVAIQAAREAAPDESPLESDIVRDLRAMAADPERLLRRFGIFEDRS